MRSLAPSALTLSLLLGLLSALPGCPEGSDAPARTAATSEAPPPPPDTSTSPAPEPDAPPTSAPPQTADASAAAPTDHDTTEPDRPTERERLARAYVDLYCAQSKGETTELRAIYRRFGFDGPKAWQLAFEGASKDHQWLAEVTRRALAACP